MTTLQSRATCLLLLLIVSTSVALCLDPQKDLRQFGHRSWQTDSGLPQNTVDAILQTRDGYIWLGTEGGLVRFDGVQFVTYDEQAPASLPSATINSLFEDSEGSLWIGTDDGLVRRRGSQFAVLNTSNGLPSNTIWSTFQDRNGVLWVVTPRGLARYRNGNFDAFPVASGITSPKSVVEAVDGSLWIGTNAGVEHFLHPSIGPCRGILANGTDCGTPQLPPVQALAADRDGRIWAGTQTGLYSIDAGAANASGPLPGLPSNEITALATDKHRGLWIGTAKGLSYLRDGALAAYSAHNGLPADRVESIFEDREGATWVATRRGLARAFGDKLEAVASPDGLSSELALSIFEDHEGSLWVGTESGGLEMLHDQKFTTYTTADGLSDDLIRSVFQDRNGSAWIGTGGGGLNRFADGRFSHLTTANGLSSNIVLALSGDDSGALWVGTPDGLNKIQNEHVTVYTSADGLADDFVRSLYADSDGSTWIGTRHGLSHLQNGRFTSYSAMDGLGNDLVGAIAEDSSHTLWIGTLGGLTRFDHGKFSTLTMRDGLTGNVITALYPDRDGNLWIGTNQGGLNRLRNGKVTAYPPQNTGLPESIYAILEDARGNLWLSSKTGIYSVAKHELDDFAANSSSPITSTAYGTADGMKISEASNGGHPAAWKLLDGTMWFATLKGIAAVDPEHLSRNIVPPPVAIDEVLIDDKPIDKQPVDAAATLTVAPGIRRFEFRYAGLSFIAPQKVRFRYKLDGFDHNWVDAGTRRTAYYTNLPPGSYSFHVLASNNDGVWNDTGASFYFQLRPHFYQTFWFYLAIALGLALLIYAIYRWRVQQVELRYDAVLSERGRIAREIHDTLAQGLVGISVHLELVNRLLSSSVESAREQLDHARNLVRGSLTEARSSIWDLRSQAAETEDFATRLGRMAATATETSAPKIRVNSKVSGTYRPLAPKTEAELLRIAQEAVTNAVRHAKPSHLTIELRFSARDLEMIIQDDGCGFDGQPHPQSSGPHGHFGLTGMRERTAEIGGTLDIASAPGKGTRITVSVPLES